MAPAEKKIFSISLVVKLILACWIPLVADEYYYWLWGQNLQWSYFDHPPMVGWLMAIGDLFKSLSPEAIRWPFVILSHGTLWIWLKMTAPLFSQRQRLLFLWVLLLNPLTGWGALVASPDSPLLFFWSLSLFYAQKLVRQPTWGSYCIFGILLGLGFLSKYMIVVFIPCLMLWISIKKYWSYLWTPKLLLALIFGLIACLPVIWWNSNNQWISFGFQWNHGTGASQKDLKWPLEYFVGQFFLVFPVFFIGACKNWKIEKVYAAFGFVPLLFFFATSFFARVEANWPLMAYPALFAVAILGTAPSGQLWMGRTVKLWATLLILVLSTPLWFKGSLQQKYPLKIFESQKLSEAIEFLDNDLPIYVDNYQKASFFSFHGDRLICKMPNVGRKDFFSFIEACETIPNPFYFISHKDMPPDFSSSYPQFRVENVQQETEHFTLYKVSKLKVSQL